MKNQGDVSQERREDGTVKTEGSRFTARDLTSEYVLFNHGILFGPAGLRDPEEDPLIEWFNKLGDSSEHVLRQAVETPICRGLDTPAIEGRGLTWNNLFLGVRKHLWPSLFQFLCDMVLSNRNADHVYLVTANTMAIPDPILVDRLSILTMSNIVSVPIVMFGLDGSRDCLYFLHGPRGIPCLVESKPLAATIKLWEQIKTGDMAGLAKRITQGMEAFNLQHTEMRQEVEEHGPSRNYRRIQDAD